MLSRTLAGLTALWICFGFARSLKSGVMPFSHDPRLAIRRRDSPIVYWIYAAIILAVIVCLLSYAAGFI